jgi:hypothetical protein
MDRAEARQRRRAMREGEVERPASYLVGIGAVGETGFLGKSIGIQPVNELLAPAGDDSRLGIMHMRIDKARGDERVAIIGHFRLGMSPPQIVRLADGGDAIAFNKDAATRGGSRHLAPVGLKRITGEGQRLAEKKMLGHGGTLRGPIFLVNRAFGEAVSIFRG